MKEIRADGHTLKREWRDVETYCRGNLYLIGAAEMRNRSLIGRSRASYHFAGIIALSHP